MPSTNSLPPSSRTALHRAILHELAQLRPGTTICPGQLARRLGLDQAALRPHLLRLAERGQLSLRQKNRPVNPSTLRGPYRVGPAPTLPDWVELRRSPIHGTGIFAAKRIPRNTRILEYVGERINKTEGYRRAMRQLQRAAHGREGAVYIFELNRRWDLDGNVWWNPARLINHSCRPNCETRVERGRVWIYSKQAIPPGEELSYDYGYEVEFYREHPCRCGAPGCVGHIVRRDQWPQLRKLLTTPSR